MSYVDRKEGSCGCFRSIDHLYSPKW